MSILIDLQQQLIYSPQAVKQALKSLFRFRDFNCKNIEDNGTCMTCFLDATKHTYRLSTAWKLNFGGPYFSLQIMFYNSEKSDFLRATSDRMKIQLSILIKNVNLKVIPSFMFVLDCQSGLLKLASYESWPVFYSLASKKQQLVKLINNFFAQIRRFDELIVFIEPAVFDTKDINEKDKSCYGKINRFRALLKSTKNTRRQIQACFKDLIRIKQQNRPDKIQQYDQIRQLYMKNVTNFQKSTYGLNQSDQYFTNSGNFQSQYKQVRKNETGITNYEQENKNGEKIVYGIEAIYPDQQKQNKQKLFSMEGAHSKIYRKSFHYVVVWTINLGTIDMDEKKYPQLRKQEQGELTYKICNKMSQTSINSFNNQIRALNYMRDMYSPFVAKYYLMVKKLWDQNDIIYMTNYRQNVHSLLQNCTAFNLKTRLQLAYKIAKGLCFMYSKQLVHRDFKPQNVVVDKNLNPKIIDFGSTISHYQKNKYTCFDQRLLTTPGYNIQYYSIPISHQQLINKYSKPQYDEHPLFDVYGFGRTLCYIFFGTTVPPQPQMYLSQPIFQVMDHLIFLINMCINVDPEDRPGFGQLTAFLGQLNKIIKTQIIQASQQYITQ